MVLCVEVRSDCAGYAEEFVCAVNNFFVGTDILQRPVAFDRVRLSVENRRTGWVLC